MCPSLYFLVIFLSIIQSFYLCHSFYQSFSLSIYAILSINHSVFLFMPFFLSIIQSFYLCHSFYQSFSLSIYAILSINHSVFLFMPFFLSIFSFYCSREPGTCSNRKGSQFMRVEFHKSYFDSNVVSLSLDDYAGHARC